jgi:hypothetical protein
MTQTLFISEFSQLPFVNGHPVNIVEMPPIVTTSQTVAVTSTSAQSSTLSAATRVVRIHLDNGATSGACIRFGSNPVALTTDTRLAVNQTEYFFVIPGTSNKIAAISSSS